MNKEINNNLTNKSTVYKFTFHSQNAKQQEVKTIINKVGLVGVQSEPPRRTSNI
jgi:hypothetical protein